MRDEPGLHTGPRRDRADPPVEYSSALPGHRFGRGIDDRTAAVLSRDAFAADVLLAKSAVPDAENRYADAIGAKHAVFAACGSSASTRFLGPVRLIGGLLTTEAVLDPLRLWLEQLGYRVLVHAAGVGLDCATRSVEAVRRRLDEATALDEHGDGVRVSVTAAAASSPASWPRAARCAPWSPSTQ